MPTPPPAFSPLADALLEQATDFAGLYDARRARFTRVNAAGAQLLGYASAADFLAAPQAWTEQLPAADWPALLAEAARAGQHTATVEMRGADTPAGEAGTGRLELTYFGHENPPFYLVRLRLQGRLQRAEQELAQSKRRFEAVVTNATIGIIVCNRAGTIVLVNHLAQQQFGYAEDELTGRPIELLVPAAVGQHHERLRASFNAAPTVRAMGHNRDLLARRRDGSEFPVEVSLSYFQLHDELYVVSYIIDITFKKEAERELIAQRQRVERLNAELEQKVAERTHALLSTLAQLEQRTEELARALAAEQQLGELKSRFVSMASHEFRTPLTGVLTSAALIEKYPGADQQPQRLRHLSRIRASVTHLNDILEEFLSVGRIEEGRIEARPGALQLPALLAEAVTDVRGLHKAGQRIAQHVQCPAPLWLDSSLLRKILVNLLSNALKYSGENAVVTLRATAAAGWLTLVVQDEGVGISADDQAHLFERFFRARSAGNVPGTGLGLYIVARYLELLGGRIELQSALGTGTTVTVTIPYDEDHSAD